MICENARCDERFVEIEKKLNQEDKKLAELGVKIENLIASQKMLTTASWSLASTILVSLIGFVLGKI